jgi:hypothetical protein
VLILRIVLLVLMLAGGALGIAYPWVAANQSGYQVGVFPMFDGTGFRVAETRPAPSETPLFIIIEMTTRGPMRADRQGAVLTLTATSGGRTVLAQALDFEGVNGRIANPQTGEIVYRTQVGRIDEVAEDGLSIAVKRGDADAVTLSAVDVIVEASALDIDPRAVPAGYVMLAIGFVGFILSFRSRAPKNPNSSPPPPKWGRQ